MLPHISPNTYGISGPMLNSKTAVRGGSREAGKAGGKIAHKSNLYREGGEFPVLSRPNFLGLCL